MTRATHATRPANSPTEELLPAWVADARAEIAALRVRVRAPKLADSTRTEYERRAKRLASGRVELVGVCKRELALWKAAGKWKMGERVREAMNEADMLWRHGRRIVEVGPDGREQVRREPFASNADKWRAWRTAVNAIRQRAAELDAFLAEAEGWKAASGRTGDAVVRKEASHKKRPLRPGEARRFFAAVGSSAFRPALLAAYFCGARPQEFAGGVTVRRAMDPKTNRPGLLLTIHDRAKRDGDKKGQAQGRIFIADDAGKSAEARALFEELRELAYANAGEVKIAVAPTSRQSTGQRLTLAAQHFALKAFPEGERPSFYSLPQRQGSGTRAPRRGHGSGRRRGRTGAGPPEHGDGPPLWTDEPRSRRVRAGVPPAGVGRGAGAALRIGSGAQGAAGARDEAGEAKGSGADRGGAAFAEANRKRRAAVRREAAEMAENRLGKVRACRPERPQLDLLRAPPAPFHPFRKSPRRGGVLRTQRPPIFVWRFPGSQLDLYH